jgi:hypothetical protein
VNFFEDLGDPGWWIERFVGKAPCDKSDDRCRGNGDTRTWPPCVPREYTMDAVVKAYESIGFRLCYGPALEAGVEKLALFGKTDQHRRIRPTHAALQLSCGNWTSKLGEWPDRALAPRKKLKTIPLMETLRFHDKRPSPFTARP